MPVKFTFQYGQIITIQLPFFNFISIIYIPVWSDYYKKYETEMEKN